MSHPVIELLEARRASDSLPGARRDREKLALVIEGGGMRGIVSSAMTAVLEGQGFLRCFDLVIGCSAGALNGAAFLAGVAHGCTEEYSAAFASRAFINPWRALIGRTVVNVARILDHSSEHLDAERHHRTLANSARFQAIATDVEHARVARLTAFKTLSDLRQGLLASTRLPWAAGAPVEFRGRRYLDGGLIEAIPLPSALDAGATHLLVLQTRPHGLRYPKAELVDALVERQLRAARAEAVIGCYRERGASYDRLCEEVADRASSHSGPSVLSFRMPKGTREVSRLERGRAKLRQAALEARSVALATLGRAER